MGNCLRSIELWYEKYIFPVRKIHPAMGNCRVKTLALPGNFLLPGNLYKSVKVELEGLIFLKPLCCLSRYKMRDKLCFKKICPPPESATHLMSPTHLAAQKTHSENWTIRRTMSLLSHLLSLFSQYLSRLS